jgi:hypothetical protein
MYQKGVIQNGWRSKMIFPSGIRASCQLKGIKPKIRGRK